MCIKKFIDKMIEIGNNVITAITIGQTTPEKIDWGADRVWPEAISYYLNISPTAATINDTQTTGSIRVDTNLDSWNVYESLSWVTTSKSSTGVSWTASTNNSSGRTGNIYVSGGSLSETFYLQQKGGHYMNMLTTPYAINETGGTIEISFVSTYRDEPMAVTSAVTYSTGSGWISFQSLSQNGNIYTYRFTCDRSTDTQARYATFTFTQTGAGGTSATIQFTQKAMHVPDAISGFNMYTYYTDAQGRDWQIGWWKQGEVVINNQTYPLRGIAILTTGVTMRDYTADYEVTYYTGIPGPSYPTYNTKSGPTTIPAGTTLSIPSGGTAYGVAIVSPNPNLTMTGVSGFTVS